MYDTTDAPAASNGEAEALLLLCRPSKIWGIRKLLRGMAHASFFNSPIQCLAVATVDVPSVWTDRVATAAALDNLFSNAVKYSPPGKRIWVEVVAQQNEVVCSVRDEGPGLSQEDQAKLFQRGITLTPKPTGGEPSAGYGLAVAKQLIEKVGGTIWCESVLGKGACFSFRLPQYQEHVHGSERKLPGSHEGVEQGSRTAPYA